MTTRLGIVLCTALCCLGCGQSEFALQWEPTGGPVAQNVAALVADERNPGSLLAGLLNGDIYRSSDFGGSWALLHRDSQRKHIYRLLQHPEEPARMYAASQGGLFVSTNRGRDWAVVGIEQAAQKQPSCLVVVIDPWKTSTMFAGLKGRGISKSTNGGKSWTPTLQGTDARLGMSDVVDIAIDPSRPDVVYAAVTGGGIIRSTDGGASWLVVSVTDERAVSNPTTVLVHRSANATLLFGTASGAIYRSTNGGESWSQTRQGQEADEILSLSSTPTNHDLIFAGTAGGILYSTDFGGTWLSTSSSLPSVATRTTVVQDKSRPVLLAFGSGIGLQMSPDNGARWSRADAGLGGSTVSLIISTKAGDRVYGAAEASLLRYDQSRNEWIPEGSGLRGGTVLSACIDQESPQVMYATTSAGMFRTISGRGEWQPFARTLPSPPRFIVAHPWYKNRFFASGETGIFYSTNSGKSWGQARPVDMRYGIRSVTLIPTNAGQIYASTRDGGVLQSTNGGLSWEQRRFGLGPDDILAVTLDGEDAQTLYAWTAAGECFRTTNAGTEWNRYSVPWGAGNSVRIAYDESDPTSVVALVDGRDLYHSHSGGGTWRPMLLHGPSFRPATLHWNKTSSTVYVGTIDSGVFKISLKPVIDFEAAEE